MKGFGHRMNWGRLPGVIAVLALLFNLLLPAFQAQAAVAEGYVAPFEDVLICSAHQPADDGLPAPVHDPAKLCAACLVLGHLGAIAAPQTVALILSPVAVAAPDAALAATLAPTASLQRPFAPRAPPAV